MLQARAEGQLTATDPDVIDSQFKIVRGAIIVVLGLFGGGVLGGVIGLFVYANSRTPTIHDGVFALIQAVGILLGTGLGYLAARSAEAQEHLIDASARAGAVLLKKYRPKPGLAGHSNVGQRVIKTQSNEGEEYLQQILNGRLRNATKS